MNLMDITLQERTLYQKAEDCMKRALPDWNADMPSDPAMAALELAVQLSALQENTFEQIQDAHNLSYAKLLGTLPQRCSAAYFWADVPQRKDVYHGQRFWVDGVPFEVAYVRQDVGTVESVTLQKQTECVPWDRAVPLTLTAQENGAILWLSFSQALPSKKMLWIWCELLPEEGRTPADGTLPFPITLRGLLRDGSQFAVRDGTSGLLRSGFLSFQLPKSVQEIGFQLVGELEGQPTVSKLVLEPVLLVQRQTRSIMKELTPPFRLPKGLTGNRTLRFFVPLKDGWREASGLSASSDGIITGFSNNHVMPEKMRVCAIERDFLCDYSVREIAEEEIILEEEGILPSTLCIMTEENGIWYDCPVEQFVPQKMPLRGCRWDRKRHTLCFGDGRDLPIPKAGQVLVSSCACTLGASGNGAGGILEQEGVQLASLHPAAGGRDEETARETFLRAVQAQENARAVCLADYERIARQTPGLALKKVRALRTEKKAGVTVLVQPCAAAKRPELTAWQAQRLQMWLERFRMISVPVTVRGPVYVPVTVAVSVRVGGSVDCEALRQAVLRLTDGVIGPLDFGAVLSYAAVFAALRAVPHVQAVESLELHISGVHPVQEDWEGKIQLAPDMLPYLDDFTLDTLFG